jgi:hypothetical protein
MQGRTENPRPWQITFLLGVLVVSLLGIATAGAITLPRRSDQGQGGFDPRVHVSTTFESWQGGEGAPPWPSSSDQQRLLTQIEKEHATSSEQQKQDSERFLSQQGQLREQLREQLKQQIRQCLAKGDEQALRRCVENLLTPQQNP